MKNRKQKRVGRKLGPINPWKEDDMISCPRSESQTGLKL